ncbi:tripartite tricarboxylate transporter substrate binding protein [Limnohabitans sp. Rim47]|jgi:tripartite-type tricarboxylate transporter receptor subunit TctC|uniref:Bug family tripartite tricarboxylate transporter substrate binding protein n=1 Tax=Limnohabitans sp. Rim47 TaxID=1100721 RepID=UPI0002E13DB5|nr:tripartite tricarboxylate transporter substrate binding protein [Limnohabitans sp. Rim47]
MMKKRQLLTAIGLAGLGLLGQGQAIAQADYPNKPIKLIVAFPPGGTSDVMGRLVAEELGKVLKQPIVVENIAGAGGIVGMDRALKLPADGYTLIQSGVGQNAVAHGLDANLKYNSMTDFIHLSQVNSGPNVLLVHPSQPFKTVKDLVDYAKKNPGKLDYGFTHAASGHMAMELFKQTTGIFLTGIPYKGGGPMLNDLLAGTIPMVFLNQDVALPHVKAGKLRAIAVSSKERNSLYPDTPTVAESGYKGFEATSWSGISVAKGTPQAIVDKLEAGMAQAMKSDAFRNRLTSVGFVVPPSGSKHYVAFLKSELDQWTRVIKAAGIKAE